jgi:hypothetical protein
MDHDDDGVASQATTFKMDCDRDNIPFDPHDRMEIEPEYPSHPITENSRSRVGNSNQGPSYDFQVRSSMVSNAPFRFQDGKEDREDIDSEDDYETIHGGLDIHDESRVSLFSHMAMLRCASVDFFNLTLGSWYSGRPHWRTMHALNTLEPARIG